MSFPSPGVFPSSDTYPGVATPGAPQPGGYTPTTIVGAQLCEAMQPWLTPALAWVLDLAVGTMFQQVASLVTDVGQDGDADYVPGYGVLFDPNNCPDVFLPYLANFAGVPVVPGADPETVRSMILMESGQQRGRPSAIIAAAKRFLTGTQSVDLIQRTRIDGSRSRWAFLLIVRPEELSQGPDWAQEDESWSQTEGTFQVDDQTAQLIAAVNATKPAGTKWWLVTTDGHTWSQATKKWSAETSTFQQADINAV